MNDFIKIGAAFFYIKIVVFYVKNYNNNII